MLDKASVIMIIYLIIMLGVYVGIVGLVLVREMNEFLMGVLLFYVSNFSAGGMFVYALMSGTWLDMLVVFMLPVWYGYIYSRFLDGMEVDRGREYSGIGLITNYTLVSIILVWGKVYLWKMM